MKAIKNIVRKYYKYAEVSFIQPTLASNGTIGGNRFAVDATYGSCTDGSTDISSAYLAFDYNTSTAFVMWSSSTTTPQTLSFYNPNPITFDSITVNFFSNKYGVWGAIDGSLQGSNDNSTWETIATFSSNSSDTLTLSGNGKYYKYFQFTGTTLTQVYNSIDMSILEIVLSNATEKIGKEATASDYDYYVDESTYNIVADIVKDYYKYKSPAEGYRELMYIKSEGYACISTNYYPDSNTRWQAKYIYSTYAGTYLFGFIVSGSDSFRFMRASSKTYLDYGGDSNRVSGTYIDSTTDVYETEVGNRYVKDLTTNTVKFSGSSVSFSTKSEPIYIFSNVDYGTIFYFKIYNGDTLARDMIPCERLSDNAIGMYDRVGDVFYENTSTSSFIAGDYSVEEGTESDYDYYVPRIVGYKAVK